MRLLVLSTVLALLAPNVADACSPIGYAFHDIDPLQAADGTPPSAVTVGAPAVERFPPDDDETCGARPLCGGPNGYLSFSVTATDDATPIERLGYQVTVAGGNDPGFYIPQESIRAEPDGYLRLHFVGDDLGAFALDLEVRAVDLNGNLGPPVIVAISAPSEESGGCAMTSRAPSLVITFGLLALAALVRRRR